MLDLDFARKRPRTTAGGLPLLLEPVALCRHVPREFDCVAQLPEEILRELDGPFADGLS